jgi:hypothetical protein
MTELTPANAHAFFKRFQFRGGYVRRFRIRNMSADSAVGEVRLTARDTQTNQPVRLRITFEGLEEYRFQRRPGPGLVRLTEVQVGFFGPLVYLNLDAFAEEGPPKVMDFRASDCFLAGRAARWEVEERKTKS